MAIPNVSLSYRAHTIRVTEQTTVSNKLISFYQKRFSETSIVSTVRRDSNGKYIFEFREFFVWLWRKKKKQNKNK